MLEDKLKEEPYRFVLNRSQVKQDLVKTGNLFSASFIRYLGEPKQLEEYPNKKITIELYVHSDTDVHGIVDLAVAGINRFEENRLGGKRDG